MLGKRGAAWVGRLLVLDLLTLLVCFVVAHKLRIQLNRPLGRAAAPLGHYLWLLQLILPVWIGLLGAMGAYGVNWTTRSRAWLVLRVSGIGLLLLIAGLFLVKESEINRSVLGLFALVSGAGLWLERGLVCAWLRRARRHPRWSRVALVVGADERVNRVDRRASPVPRGGLGGARLREPRAPRLRADGGGHAGDRLAGGPAGDPPGR